MTIQCGAARRLLLDRAAPQAADDRRLSARRHVDTCERCRDFLAESAASAAMLQEAVAITAPPELRERLFDALAAARTQTPRRRRFPAVTVAVIAASLAALVLANRASDRSGFDEVLSSLAADHALATTDGRLVSSDLGEVERWLTARVGFAVRAPVLAGARVVGARTCITPNGPGAVVEYEIDGRRVSYFILDASKTGESNRAVRTAAAKGYAIAHWYDRGLAHAFVAALPATRVEALAHECIEQMRGGVARHKREFSST